jgi:8-oxo-dGTP pyrophosphatase MutT (NUDIX family)
MEAREVETAEGVDVIGTVRAAGGVVWRAGAGGEVEVLMVHRPKYDDWSLPKGKLAPGEDEVTGALREVEEETGLRCRVVRPIGSVSYRDGSGAPKVVDYFEMRPESGAFEPGDEVDAVMWLPVPQALDRLAYSHDRELLATFEPGEHAR